MHDKKYSGETAPMNGKKTAPADGGTPIGEMVRVVVDRPLGSVHPRFPSLRYPVNYGYVPGVFSGDGEEQDAYLIGVTRPVEAFTGRIVAVVRRENDVEDKWVVAPEGADFSYADIETAVRFQERYFRYEIIM